MSIRNERIHPERVRQLRREAEAAAGTVLDLLWDLDTFPVDPFKLAEDYGAEVHRVDLPEDLEGMFRPAGSKYDRAQIWVDTDTHIHRQRFSCAHELGHMVQDGEAARMDRRRDGVSSAGTDEHEIYANAFAAELLMPSYAVNRLAELGAPLTDMARFFAVSPVAMSNRLRNLGHA